MSHPFKPDGYNSVSPYFIVNEASRFITMLKEIFAAEELSRYDNPDGTIMHAEVRIDDSVIMLSDATEKYPPLSIWMHVYVPDSKAIYEKALAYGCEGIEAPVQKGDPDLRGTFKDFAGNYWAVGTKIL